MIIVSQDKEIIINFNNVQAINVHYQNKKQVCAWFNVDEDPNGSVVLGEYKTEERAKEVIKDIVYIFQKQNDNFYYQHTKRTEDRIYAGYQKQHKDNVFYIPEE